MFGGTTLVDVKLEGSPKLVLVRPKSFEASPAGGQAEVVPVEVDDRRRAQEGEAARAPRGGDDRTQARGGASCHLRRPGSSGARQLRAARPARFEHRQHRRRRDSRGCRLGWVPYAMQIGQTGTTVKPNVYLAFGISGATQHLVGMKGAKKIVAVNKDEEAPIFQIADLGIVGDALKILPQLIEEVKSRKG